MSTTTPLAQWKTQLPTWLTLSRVFITPFIIACLVPTEPEYGYLAAALFILGALTDWWDGYFARRYNVVSNFGKFMDPVADKILVSCTLIMLIPIGRVDALLVMLLIARDILIGGVRSVAAADNIIIDARYSGKVKTVVQMIGIPAVLIHDSLFGVSLSWLGYVLLWVSVALSLFSGCQYVAGYMKRDQSI